MKKIVIHHQSDLARTETWLKYRKGLCDSCHGTCCTMPVEVRIGDLVRMGVVDEFEAGEPAKQIAKRLEKAGIVAHFNFKNEITMSVLVVGVQGMLDISPEGEVIKSLKRHA